MDNLQWNWIEVNKNMEEFKTYNAIKYEDFKINDLFKDITTLEDVNNDIEYLNEIVRSPTASYFSVDRETKIFYRDQQDCVLWAFDEELGYVYLYDYENDTDREYCAKSIPEFISHIYEDSINWFAIHRPQYDVFSCI